MKNTERLSRGNLVGIHLQAFPNLNRDDALEVAKRVRSTEKYECESVGAVPEDLVLDCLDYATEAFMVYLRGSPVFVFGTMTSYPQCRAIFGWGTPEARRVMPFTTRYIRDEFIPLLKARGVTRAEVRLPSIHKQNIAWLKSLGLEEEATILGLSLDGVPYTQLAYTTGPTHVQDQSPQNTEGSGTEEADLSGHPEGV